MTTIPRHKLMIETGEMLLECQRVVKWRPRAWPWRHCSDCSGFGGGAGGHAWPDHGKMVVLVLVLVLAVSNDNGTSIFLLGICKSVEGPARRLERYSPAMVMYILQSVLSCLMWSSLV